MASVANDYCQMHIEVESCTPTAATWDRRSNALQKISSLIHPIDPAIEKLARRREAAETTKTSSRRTPKSNLSKMASLTLQNISSRFRADVCQGSSQARESGSQTENESMNVESQLSEPLSSSNLKSSPKSIKGSPRNCTHSPKNPNDSPKRKGSVGFLRIKQLFASPPSEKEASPSSSRSEESNNSSSPARN